MEHGILIPPGPFEGFGASNVYNFDILCFDATDYMRGGRFNVEIGY